MKYVDDFFSGDIRTTGLSGKKEVICMANSCAFEFWQRAFKVKPHDYRIFPLVLFLYFARMQVFYLHICVQMKDKCRLEHLRQLFKLDNTKDREIVLPKIEEEWCLFHNLLQSALNQVAESCMSS